MEEKKEVAPTKWPVKWANVSKRLAKIGWWVFLLNILLLVIGIVVVELLLDIPSPNKFEHVFGIILAILAWGTVLCFLSSFVVGIASLFAPLFNIVCFKDIKRNALRGVSYSLLYFFVLSTLMSPVIFRKIRYAKLHCRRNLNLISREIFEHSVWTTHDWCDALKDEPTFDIALLRCNYDKIGPCSYAMNENIPVDVNELPGDLVLLFESAPGWNQVGGVDDVVTDRHGKAGANIAFADGSVEFVEAEEIPKLRWTVEDKSVERK